MTLTDYFHSPLPCSMPTCRSLRYPSVVLAGVLCSLAIAHHSRSQPPETGETGSSPAPISNSVGMTMVLIPAGSFQMGSPDRETGRNNNEGQVPVTISKPFLMSDTEVTQEQWTEVMGNSPWDGAVENAFAKKGPRFPAVGITWDEAVAFCKELTESEREAGKIDSDVSYSLPTEAQWDYACRAGSRKAYSFGHDASQLGDFAWWGGDVGDGNASEERYAHEVAKKNPNKWMLFDLHGNVSEWCQDGSAEELRGGTDPVAPAIGHERAVRGGSWEEGGFALRCASRSFGSSASSSFSRGLRVVRNVSESDGVRLR